MVNSKEEKEPLSLLNIAVIALSIYILIAFIIDTLCVLPKEISTVLGAADNCICLFFLFEFALRFRKSTNKLAFMKWGWIDLLSSLPTFDVFRAGRALRLIRLLRILRAFKSTRHLIQHIFKNKTQGIFTSALLCAFLMIIFSSIAILQVEIDPDSNIKTAEDAIWWAYVTITTVGYGDKYPVTLEGRIIAAVLMTVGVGLFGIFTGYLASWFVGIPNNKN